MTVSPSSARWMSPVQRAAALKRQQRYLRELEEASRPEWDKKHTVLSMSIKNGKLVRTVESVKRPFSLEAEAQVEVEEESVGNEADRLQAMDSKGSGLSRNPLLAEGGLLRPIWTALDGRGLTDKGNSTTERNEGMWRRVQYETEDNERWILDGGLSGLEEGQRDGGSS
jgi:hexokinase